MYVTYYLLIIYCKYQEGVILANLLFPVIFITGNSVIY